PLVVPQPDLVEQTQSKTSVTVMVTIEDIKNSHGTWIQIYQVYQPIFHAQIFGALNKTQPPMPPIFIYHMYHGTLENKATK
ncbi:hypothetical protein, partial [Actinobacillus pleuropneumoniae]|uniref:hypothetical protein n=1 Tax=Actinobacillus pleuropneumoniae TaxID=715 RepID=UPI00227ADC84